MSGIWWTTFNESAVKTNKSDYNAHISSLRNLLKKIEEFQDNALSPTTNCNCLTFFCKCNVTSTWHLQKNVGTKLSLSPLLTVFANMVFRQHCCYMIVFYNWRDCFQKMAQRHKAITITTNTSLLLKRASNNHIDKKFKDKVVEWLRIAIVAFNILAKRLYEGCDCLN